MTLLRGYDEIADALSCSGHGGECEYPAAQTIRMASVPHSREGDTIKASQVRWEYVGICEGHWKAHFPVRATWIPQRFIAGLD